jgi:tRNA (guanine26-N2/guanine27-N2)-dimethyltransferase
MWSAPIHNKEFTKEMLTHIEEKSGDFKTAERIKGMLTVAHAVRPCFPFFFTSLRARNWLIELLRGEQEVEAPLYFSPAKMASLFNAICPPLHTFGCVSPSSPANPHLSRSCSSALLNGGFSISRSHAVPGSIKTNAPRTFVHDIIREWIKTNPVKMGNVKDGSPAKVLLAKEQV